METALLKPSFDIYWFNIKKSSLKKNSGKW
jgi:hypothetical protein